MAAKEKPIAVLTSGGLDSAILVGELARAGRRVHPLYVRSGLAWEPQELTHLRRFLSGLGEPALPPLAVLDLPVQDLYGDHWSLTGVQVPDADSADEAVYLPGRNLLLTVKALIWCHLHQVPVLALGILKGNPFPDARDSFFQALAAAAGQALAGDVRIDRPYCGLDKEDVLRRGAGMPLQWTFSCIQPQGDLHCGRCNKCAERRRAFLAANLRDPTPYAGVISGG